MRRLFTRSGLVVVLAVVALLGAAVILGSPDRKSAQLAATTDPASPTRELDAYVARTTAHLARVPGDWPAWAQLGMAHVQLARIGYDPAHYPLAEKALRTSLREHPRDNALALTGLGTLAAARHNFRTALGYARRAVAVDHYSADAYGVLTDANVELGRYDDATSAVQRMLDLRPDTGSYARASYLFELEGNLPRATKLMSQALNAALSPSDTTFALLHLGELAFGAGDLDTAAARFAEGLGRQPGQPALLADRARVEAARGDLTTAIADLRTASATLPTVDHLVALSDTLTASGDPRAAARVDNEVRVTTRLPGATSAATDIDLVLFHADHGEAQTAVAKGKALLAARPSVSVEVAYGWALHAAGNDRAAIVHADRGLRLGTRDAKGHFYRGMIRLGLGDRSGARLDLREALAINPYFSLRYAPIARAELQKLDGTP